MSGAALEAEAGRARPLSGGLWSLISWLRRDDSGASSDSLSSVGSDRTVASIAFLSPDRYRHPAAPVLLPPPGPPTDSYKKRLRDRNSRLQHDRDLTLHRKYGLFRGDNGYDAFSLPPARKSSENNWKERERRATSECVQRRAAHVPGKRRAPAPPARSATLGAPRRSRKRPAPQPPRRPLSELGRNAPIPEEPLLVQTDTDLVNPALRRTESMDCKPEKYIKKENKDSKPRTEKSFLKQIFEGRKRNSAVDTVPERILPSISELDKQAAEIIESCKLKALDRSNERAAGTSRELVTPSKGDMWFCTRCLRKYNDSVVTCGYCITEQKIQLNKNDNDRRLANRASSNTQTVMTNVASASGVNVVEEKQKLKEMLKEIKNSLPKRAKHEVNDNKINNHKEISKPSVVEAPTLRIGTKIKEEKVIHDTNSTSVNIEEESRNKDAMFVTNTVSTSATETAVVTQPIVLQHIPSRDIVKLEHFRIAETKQGKLSMNSPTAFDDKNIITKSNSATKHSIIPESKYKIDSDSSTSGNAPSKVPLKISSLLNSSPTIEKQLQKIPHNLQFGTQDQRSYSNQTTTAEHEAKPLVAATATSGQKAEHKTQEQTTQKPLKATSTTQTSSNVVFDIAAKCKRNITIIKDQDVNNKLSSLKPDAEINNGTPLLPTSSASFGISSSGPQTKTFSAPGPSVHDKRMNIDNIGNQQKKSLSQNAPYKVSGEIPKLDLHSRRRDLINQLEQSIAKGDERAAADAAAKLAQLRLSCSVLSFSSQIVGAPSTSLTDPIKKTNDSVSNKTQMEDTTQPNDPKKSNTTSPDNIAASSSKTLIEKKPAPMQPKSEVLENIPVYNERKINEPSTSNKKDAAGNDNVSIEVWIEDREAARGPIRINMPRVSVMGDLRRQANASFGLAAHLQRWIVGRTLCTDDSTPLNTLAGPKFDAPFYLCLVEPDTNKQSDVRLGSSSNNKTEGKNQNVDQPNGENKATDVYAELVLLERRALVPNAEVFECGVCMENYQPGKGAVLRECVHMFCMECLSDVVKHSEEPAVSCPAMGCPGFLQEREIRALVSLEEYERWLARGLAAAESGTRNAFHCRTADCQGWALCEPGVTRFPCPVCKRTNCVSCQAIHEGDTCEQYRAKQQAVEAANREPEETDEGTRAFLNTLISRGEALECPECSAIITKKWGCDWIKCSACKTEICWVTRGRRWGPGGRGDTSAGCRCGVDGKRCHPSCGYCH
ncbi:uncharacterized protein LOC133517943 [Cydia pomonella]|uniref:uncharacterized protein LOC133517943 n=1 Tax=Cydia pomonella TaxID=82600 RepID=UPI002ADDA5B7|nr:uncharacterized protein LOC133517943 [Cydia pomonella]XP_061707411.1 uncharacterized protein LOC133517943 [Cydia pomonella]